MMNIQEYTSTSQMDVRAYLLEMIYNYCKFKKDSAKEIRIILRKFKVQLRYGYMDLLKDIVASTKEELMFLLKTIPEILPYIAIGEGDEDVTPLLGVWDDLLEEEWDRVLYLGQVMTVYNKNLVLNFKTSIWIRRNFLTYHDLIYLTKV